MSFSPPLAAPPRPARDRPNAAAPAALLRADEVDLWRADLDEQPPDVVQFLQTLISADEAERARRFYFERDRRRFVVGRGILRTLLGKYEGRAPRELAFRYGANGKPGLAMKAGTPPVFFNVAHSEGIAVYAFTRVGEVGVDVERVRDLPEWETIAASYFLPRELGRIYACPADGRHEEFFRAWTRQEALLKAHGVGLGGAVGRGAGAPRRAGGEEESLLPHSAPASPAFALHPLAPAPGFTGALAVGAAAQWATHLAWSPLEAADNSICAGRSRRVRLKSISETGPVSP